jgi:transposase
MIMMPYCRPGHRCTHKARSLLAPHRITNNISERGVRPLKTQQKISGRLASDDATQDRLDIRGYIDTAHKHGQNAMNVLHDLMTGRPWRPPARAISP